MVILNVAVTSDEDYKYPSDLNIQMTSAPTILRNNEMLEIAMQTALRHGFTLIQGPPGTRTFKF